MEKIEGEHRRILIELGITPEEIEIANLRKNYEPIARKLQIRFLKSLIENSSKSTIKMDLETSRLMHELRNANNKEIVNLEVLKEDQEIYPIAIKKLMDQFADIIEEDIGIEKLRGIATNIDLIKSVMEKYLGTINEDFVRFITETTPEIFDFNAEMIKRASDMSSKGRKISFEHKMALECSAEYISTLNDFEFLSLIEGKGLVTEEQRKSLHRTYREIGREGLKKESYMQDAWKKIADEQAKSTEKLYIDDDELSH